MPPIYFTLESAQRILPQVKKKVHQLREFDEAITFLENLEIESENEYVNYRIDLKVEKEFHYLHYCFYQALEELEAWGCIIKDVEEGRVDFPHIFQGREVFLCWKWGERTIRHWHELEEGAGGRKGIVYLEDSRHKKKHDQPQSQRH